MLVTSGATVIALALPGRVPRRRLCVPQGLWWGGRLADFGQPVVQLPFVCCRRLGLKKEQEKSVN